MKLTNTAVKNAKSNGKVQKLFDGHGLFIQISKTGRKYWRFKYRYAGKEKQLALGVYPEVSLRQARDKMQQARALLQQDRDPSLERKHGKELRKLQAANSFEQVSREWHKIKSPSWVSNHAKTIMNRLEQNIFPWIGSTPVSDLKATDFLPHLRRIEERGAVETAHRVLQTTGQIMRFAVASGLIERDPTSDLKGALVPVQKKHLAAITEPKKVAGLLRAINGYKGSLVIRSALKLAPLVFVRPGELRHAKWKDINFKTAEWRFEASKTKTELIVPLSTQSIEILKELKPLTGKGMYVFPTPRSQSGNRPMSENAVLSALRTMGFEKDEMTGHGFRAIARTLLDEELGYRPDYIEQQLAHAVKDPNGRAYNRTKHLKERKEMMQAWADYLTTLMKN